MHLIFWIIGLIIYFYRESKKEPSKRFFQPLVKNRRYPLKPYQDEHGLVEDEEAYDTEMYPDEESYETEMTEPMSPEIDDGEVYTDQEWERLTSVQKTPIKTHRKKKRTALQQAILYSEILDKPKGLE